MASTSESNIVPAEMVEQIKGLIYQDDQLPSHTLNSLNKMRKNRTFCDVILHIGNVELHGHRAVLASASSYFLELFTVDDEQKGNVRNENVITYQLNGGFDRSALEKIIDYVYTAKLDVSANQVKQVYLTAVYLKMGKVARECAHYLIQQLSVDNCIEIRSLPGITRNNNFVSEVDSFITNNFASVSKTPVLLALSCIRIEVLSQTRQEMSLMTCDSICLLVLDWIKRSSEDLPLEVMIDKTHLLYLALDNSLQDCSELPSNDVSNTEIVQDYKKQAKKNSTNPSKNRRKTQMQPAKPRVLVYSREISDHSSQDKDAAWLMISSLKVSDHTFLALIVANGKLATMSVLLRLNQPCGSPSPQLTPDVAKSIVEPDLYCGLSNMISVKCAAGCANLNDSLLVCGGYDRAECLRSVELYCPSSNMWKELPPMKDARGRFNIAVVDGKVYAIGGCNGTTELATVERYDPAKAAWNKVTPLSLARSNIGVCSLNGLIYCIGGWNGQVGIRQCDVYDPNTQAWSSIAALQTGRYQAGVCSFDSKVWVAGGCDSWNCMRTVEVYDSATDNWSFSTPMITSRRGCGLAVYKGKLYAVGGSDGAHSLNTTEVYNPEDKSWSPGPSMTTARSNVGVAVIDDRLYAVGGFSGKNFLNTIEYLDDKTDEWTTFSLQRSTSSDAIENNHSPELSDEDLDSPLQYMLKKGFHINNNVSDSNENHCNQSKNVEKANEEESLFPLITAEPTLSTS